MSASKERCETYRRELLQRKQLWFYLLAAMFGLHKLFDELLNRYRDALGMRSLARLLLVNGLISAGL